MASTVVPTGNLMRGEIARAFGLRLAEFVGQATARDQVFFAHDRGALEHVAQLANVARPGVAAEDVEHFGADAADVVAVLGVDVAKDVFDEQRNVVFVIAQRRQVNVEDVEAEEEILAQLAGADGFLGIFVGRGEDANVDRRFAFAAEAANFAIFENAQELGLRGSGHFADFVEEERAAVGELEAADAAFGRAGEGAAFVAEDFAFHQRFGNCGAVDGDEGTGGARRKFVNAAGDDFFAGAGFAGDQNGCGTGRGHFDDAHDFLHRFGAADEIAEAAGFAQLALQNGELARVACFFEATIEERAQDRRFHRLFDVPEGAGFDGGDGAFIAAFAGDDDRRNVAKFVAELFQQVEAVHAGKFDVGDEESG